MLHVRELHGLATEQRCAGRRVERLPVSSAEATKRRLRRATDAGTDVALDLVRGSYLAHDAVVHEDAARIVVVERIPEPALVIRFDLDVAPDRLLYGAALIGHSFGNQHTPLEVRDGVVVVPLTTSEAVARSTVEALGLDMVELSVADVRIGCSAPLVVGHTHGQARIQDAPHGHAHD